MRRSERRQEGEASERVNRFDRGLGEDRSQGSTKILGFRNLEGWHYHSTGWAAWGRSRCGGEEVMTTRSLAFRQAMFGTATSQLRKIAQMLEPVSLEVRTGRMEPGVNSIRRRGTTGLGEITNLWKLSFFLSQNNNNDSPHSKPRMEQHCHLPTRLRAHQARCHLGLSTERVWLCREGATDELWLLLS